MAHDRLRGAKMRHYAISVIAYLTGFKSSARFSRMLKTRYGIALREFRGRAPVQASTSASAA